MFAINAHGHINYDVGTAQASVGDGGAIVLQNPVLNDADGRRILVVVSPRILRSSASVIAPNSDSGFGSAPSSALRQSRVENNVAPAPPTKSSKSQPADNVMRGEGRRDNQSFAPSTDQEIEIEAVKGTEIHYNSQTGVSVVTNDFVVRFRSAVLTARRAEINTRTGDVLLEGAVTLQRGNQMWHGERLRYNFIRREITETNGPVVSVLAPNANGSARTCGARSFELL